MRTGKDKRKGQLEEATRQMASRKYGEAEAVLSNLLTSFPGDPEVCRLLATLHLKRGQLQVALSEIKFLATAALRAQDYTLAEAMIREYLQVDPNSAQLIELLGQVYEEKGDRSSAVAQYGSAVDLLLAHPDPDFPELPTELYQKITTLMPGSAVAQRLASIFESKTTAVQYAAPTAEPEVSRAPRSPVEPRTAAEGIPAPVVSMESDADFRRLVSAPTETPPSAQEEESAAPEDVQIQKPAPREETPAPEPVATSAGWSEPQSPPAQHPSPPPAFRLTESQVVLVPDPEPVEPDLSVEAASETVPEQAVGAPVWEPPPQEVPTTAALSIDQTASRAAALKSEADAAPAPPPRKLKRKRKAVDYQAMFLRTRLSRWVNNTVAAAQFTGRLTVFLVVLSIVLPLITIGLVALTWLALEQRPSPTFQALAAAPPQSIPDPKRNGYFLLLGLGESSSVDPMKAGYERWQRVELQRPRCTDPVEETDRPLLTAADPVALSGWFRGGIPTTQFRVRRAALEGWARSNHLLTSRYEQWFTMPFEDSGFGTLTGPDCAQVLAVHRLYLAGGFAEQLEEGVARLELDMGAWRNVLANAKTLSMKRLALRAIDDDVSLLSDLLARPDLEPKLLPRLTRLARPLEPGERSLRWPMHNEFLAEVRLSERGLYAEMDTESSLALQALTRMPLPKQRALNAHAAYYDGVIKASEVPNAPLPSLYDFAQSPPRGWLDYLKNPVDNLLGMQHVPNWAEYAGSILETDARFRLGGLQARLRVPSRDRTNLLARIAEAGPPFFDPFTELPMLTNGAKTLLYSIGRDGTDNNGDPKQDIIVPIFSAAPVL